MKLNERLVFELKGLLTSVDKSELAQEKFQVDGSPFKAVTMKRKLISLLQEGNKSYEASVDTIMGFIKGAQEEMKKYGEELDQIEGKDEEGKKKERLAYSKELDEKLNREIEEAGLKVTWMKRVGTDEVIVQLMSEAEVEISLADSQQDFLKRLIEAKAVTVMATEEDVLLLGEKFQIS